MRRNYGLTTILCVAIVLIGAVGVTGQIKQRTWPVEVLLNGKPLLTGHTHIAPEDRPPAVDESCITYRGLARLLGGAKYLARQGSNLDAVEGRPARGATFRVQRAGRISSNTHRMGDEWYITLEDLVRALGANVVREKDRRFNIILEKSVAGSILALNK